MQLVTGTLSAATGSTIGNLTLANGSITDSSGAISFGDENITTSGTISSGASTLSSLTVSGATALNGGLSMDTNKFTVADATGNTAIAGTLDVTGDTSVSTFDSSGATSLATGGGAVNVASSGAMTTVKGTLNVDEAVTLDSTLGVTGNTSLAGTLSVEGASTLSGTLASGAQTVTGNITASGTLSAATGSTIGNLTLANGSITDSSGAISFGNENITTTGTLASGAQTVTGNITASGAVTGGSLTDGNWWWCSLL